MATLPSADENGRMILDVYNHFNVRPGEVLMSKNFVAWAARNRVRIDDLKAGLEFAVQEGWIVEKQNGSLELTTIGFEKI